MRESRLAELTVDLPDHPPRWVSHVIKTELIRQNVALRRSRLTAENTLAQQVITGRRDATRAQLSAVLCCMGPEYIPNPRLSPSASMLLCAAAKDVCAVDLLTERSNAPVII